MSMLKDPSSKYRAFQPINLPDRQWPSRTITEVPVWCSSDLRDGNQSLIEPMDPVRKLRFFKTLVAVGLKQIEVAKERRGKPKLPATPQEVSALRGASPAAEGRAAVAGPGAPTIADIAL